jgi:hypothetical protein
MQKRTRLARQEQLRILNSTALTIAALASAAMAPVEVTMAAAMS